MAVNKHDGGVWWAGRAAALVLMLASLAGRAEATEPVSVFTRDGVELKLTYFPSVHRRGSAEARQVSPVVLLHDHKETRAIYSALAQKISVVGRGQQKGPSFAAVTVDLRGHGESTKQASPDGTHVTLDASRIQKQDLIAMTGYDMEAVRRFLLERNDAGELNLNKLCLVGAGMGASVAANWAWQDWTTPPLAIGKQGQDVKALVLISPRWSYHGLSFQGPMRFRPLKENVAWMLMYGAESAKVKADVDRIHRQLQRFHPDPADGAGRPASSLQVTGWPSGLQGSTLVTQVGAPIEQKIIEFLVQHVGQAQLPWTARLSRLPQ